MKKPIIGIIGKVQPQYGEDIWHRIDEVDDEGSQGRSTDYY